jgi:uncharacterized protein YecT (DUF1311 family)
MPTGIRRNVRGRLQALWGQTIDTRYRRVCARLNEAYKGVQKRINEGQRQPLVASEQAWIKYRDSNCEFYGAADGTIRQIMAAECVRSMTQDRALELEKAMKLGD